MKRLSELCVGERGFVSGLDGDPAVKRRLMAMGFVPGTEVKVLRVAPMGDPVAFSLMGYDVSLRREESGLVLVEPVEEMSLASAPAEVRLVVTGMNCGWRMRHRLRGLGIGPGIELVKVSGSGCGRVQVRVNGALHHIGHGMAWRVFVKPAGECG